MSRGPLLPSPRRLAAALAPVAGLAVLLLLWSCLSRLPGVEHFLLPGPDRVALSARKHLPELLGATGRTALWSACGLVCSLLVGGAIALVFSWSPLMRAAFHPYATLLQTVPIVAIGGLVTQILGYGPLDNLFLAFFLSLFPIIANGTVGLTSVNRRLLELFTLYDASPWQTWIKLRLPGAVPHLVAGAKVSAGLSVIGAIVGEYTMGGITEPGRFGLGYAIFTAAGLSDIDYLFALTVASVLLGAAFFGAVEVIDALFLHRWSREGGERVER
jgi:NitT/TauT family transport system permease protein